MPDDSSRENIRLTSWSIAEYCHVSTGTVLGWIRSGKLKAFRLPSGHYRADRADFREFLEKWDIPVKEWLIEDEEEAP